MGVVDAVVGALAIGTWVNMCLYTFELVQLARYFQTYKKDPWVLKGAVILALCCDTLGTISNCVCVYRYTITNFGNLAALGVQGPEFPIYLTTTTVSAAACQFYLITRYLRLTKNMLVTVGLSAVAITAKGCALYTDYALTAYSALSQRDLLATSATIWLSSELASDILISLALIVYLSKFTKSAFADTKSMIFRLIFIAAESGAFTGCVATAALATFLTAKTTNVCVGIAFCLGRCYTLTLLFNLGIRNHDGGAGSSGANTSNRGTFAFPLSQVGRSRKTDLEGVTVQHETQIHIEDDYTHDRRPDYAQGQSPVAVNFVLDEKSSESASQHEINGHHDNDNSAKHVLFR